MEHPVIVIFGTLCHEELYGEEWQIASFATPTYFGCMRYIRYFICMLPAAFAVAHAATGSPCFFVPSMGKKAGG